MTQPARPSASATVCQAATADQASSPSPAKTAHRRSSTSAGGPSGSGTSTGPEHRADLEEADVALAALGVVDAGPAADPGAIDDRRNRSASTSGLATSTYGGGNPAASWSASVTKAGVHASVAPSPHSTSFSSRRSRWYGRSAVRAGATTGCRRGRRE